jgi:hypothetical protein
MESGVRDTGEDVFFSLPCFATDGRIGFFETRFEELVTS